jgi:hypothetical protein
MGLSNLIVCALTLLAGTSGAQVRENDPQARHLVPTS